MALGLYITCRRPKNNRFLVEFYMPFPAVRLRRLRLNPRVRRAVEETDLPPRRLVAPLFVRHGAGVRKPIASMPGHAQLSIDLALREAERLHRKGIGAVL